MTLTEQLTNHDGVLVDGRDQSSSRLQFCSQKHASPDDLHQGQAKASAMITTCLNHIRQLHVGIYFSYTHTKKKKCGATRLWIPHLPSLQLWRGPFLPFFCFFPRLLDALASNRSNRDNPFSASKKKETGPLLHIKRDGKGREIPRTKNPEMRSRGRLCPCLPCHANANAMPYIHDGYLCVRCVLGSCPCLSLVARHMVTWDDHSMPTVDHGPRR
jgi:hypothetical protein